VGASLWIGGWYTDRSYGDQCTNLIIRHYNDLIGNIFPWAVFQAKIMQSTTRFDDHIMNICSPETKFIFTIRYRLIPLITCSIRTRIRDIVRFCNFSSSVRLPFFGFFFGCLMSMPAMLNLESPYLDTNYFLQGEHSLLHLPSLCRATFLHRWHSRNKYDNRAE
jgi:hypothetical protein